MRYAVKTLGVLVVAGVLASGTAMAGKGTTNNSSQSLLAGPAPSNVAGDVQGDKPVAAAPAAKASKADKADTGDTKVDPALCRALVAYRPDPSVDYTSGLDTHGKAVAPADLPGSTQMQMPAKINIPLTLNLAQTLHVDPTSYPYNQFGQGTEPELGMITVEGNKVSLNGQPISDDQQGKLAALCTKAGY